MLAYTYFVRAPVQITAYLVHSKKCVMLGYAFPFCPGQGDNKKSFERMALMQPVEQPRPLQTTCTVHGNTCVLLPRVCFGANPVFFSSSAIVCLTAFCVYVIFGRHQADPGEAAAGEHRRATSGVGRRGASPSADRCGLGQEASSAHVGGRERGRKRRTNPCQEGVPPEGSSVILFLFIPGGREPEPLHSLLHPLPPIVRFESGNGSSTSSSVVEHFHEGVHAIAAIGFIRSESSGGRGGRRRTSFAPHRYRKTFYAVLHGGACSCRGRS